MQWDRELPPGTLMRGRITGVFAVVLHVQTQTYVNNWRQLTIKILTSANTLSDIDMEESMFRNSWEWNL